MSDTASRSLRLLQASIAGLAIVLTVMLGLFLLGLGHPSVAAPASQAAPTAVEQPAAGPRIVFGSASAVFSSARGAHAVAAADLDRDGDLDMLSASRDDGQIRWHRNNGGNPPAFEARGLASLAGVYAIQVADINRDGFLDIAAVGVTTVNPSATEPAVPAANGVLVWFEHNRAALPDFIPHVVNGSLAYPVGVHAADVDSDGDLDLLSASRDDNRVMWYEHNGGTMPVFTPRLLSDQMRGAVSVHAADVDGDGDVDILSASEDDDRIVWYENQGDRPATFAPRILRERLPGRYDYAKSVYGADVDGDGDTDIVYASEEPGEVGWYENNGARPPQFTQRVVTDDADHVKYVSAVDLDRDGDLDLMSASTDDNTVAWYENVGGAPAGFVRRVVTDNAQGARFVAAADLDRDGDLDLLTASRDDNTIAWHRNNTIHRSAHFSVHASASLITQEKMRHAATGDLDGDGDADVVSISESELTWYENQGGHPPTFVTRLISNDAGDVLGGRWVVVTDLNGDGRLDIMSASTDNNAVVWYENRGDRPATFRVRRISDQIFAVRSLVAADFDGDGDNDFVTVAEVGDTVVYYKNRGDNPPTFERQVVAVQENVSYARAIHTADIDRDGDLDLLTASQTDHRVAWYENVGKRSEQFSMPISINRPKLVGDGAQHVFPADMDGDGDVDVLSASEFDWSIAWFENSGGAPPAWTTHVVARDVEKAHSVVAADLDNDGDMDMVAAAEGTEGKAGSSKFVWYENNGARPPSFTTHLITDKILAAHGLHLEDLDGDGDTDIVAASRDDGILAWYENRGGQYGVEVDLFPSSHLVPGRQGEMVRLTFHHRGRPGDADIEYSSFEAVIDNVAVTSSLDLVDPRLRSLQLYRDVCCGRGFNPGEDKLLPDTGPLVAPAPGRVYMPFSGGQPDLRIGLREPVTFYIAAELTGSCTQQPAPFRLIPVLTGGTARDGSSGLPLLAESMISLDSGAGGGIEPPNYLFLNEVMADNDSVFQDPQEPGEHPDWIEIYNAGPSAVDLGGRYLSDDPTTPTKYRIPDGVRAPAWGHVVFIADGDAFQGPLHTNFRLDKTGETIGLYDTDAKGNRPVDVVTFGEQATDIAWGRYPDGNSTLRSLDVATPGGINLMQRQDVRSFFPVVMLNPGC